MRLAKRFPLIDDLKNYSSKWFWSDLSSGLTVSFILIPQAIAYSFLAGMPAIYGLYAGLIPLLIYGLMSSSRHVSIGPVAITSILLLSGLSNVAEPFSPSYISLALLVGIIVGVVQWMVGTFRLGWLVNLLSIPVITGFVGGAAIVIIITQLHPLIALQKPSSSQTISALGDFFNHLNEAHLPTLAISLIAIFFLVISPIISKKIPTPLILVLLGIGASYWFDFHELGIPLVGDIQSGLPGFFWPDWQLRHLKMIVPTVATVSLLGIVETISIAKSTEVNSERKLLQVDQEMKALGMSKIIGGFFQALPSSASFSRTAINLSMGGKTGMSSVFVAIFIALALVTFIDTLAYLPKAILSSIIVVSVIKLINIKEATRLLKIRKRDFSTLFLTFLNTIIFGIEAGVATGVFLSFLLLLYTSSRPHMPELGRLPHTTIYRNIKRFPQAKVDPRVMILRFDYHLYFWNMEYFKNIVKEHLQQRKVKPQYVILDSSSINDLDSTGLQGLEEVIKYLEKQNIILLLTSVIGPVRDVLQKAGLLQKLGANRQFLSINHAMQYIDDPEGFTLQEEPLQTNVSKTIK